MNILNVMIAEMKHFFREKEFYVMMLMFPIILIFILGTALGGDENKVTIMGAKAQYYHINEGGISEAFEHFESDLDGDLMELDKVEDRESAEELVSSGDIDALILIDNEKGSIEILKSGKADYEGKLIESVIESFTEKMSIVQYTGKMPEDESFEEYVDVQGVNGGRPRALDYFAVTMLTMIIAYLMSWVVGQILYEKRVGAFARIKTTPVDVWQVFIGKILGFGLVAGIQVFIIMTFCIKVYGVNYGEEPWKVGLIAFSLSLLMISLGVAISMFRKKDKPVGGLLNLVIVFMVFISGGYIPLDGLGLGFLEKYSYISPIKWINESIFKMIYYNNEKMLINTILVNIVVSVVLLTLAAIKFTKKEDVLN